MRNVAGASWVPAALFGLIGVAGAIGGIALVAAELAALFKVNFDYQYVVLHTKLVK